MTDPLMVFYKTKDLAPCIAKFNGVLAKEPMRAHDAHLIRLMSGFLYEAMEAGHVPKAYLRDTLLTAEARESAKETLGAAKSIEDVQTLALNTLSFWAGVQNSLDVYQGKYSVEEYVNGGWSAFAKSGIAVEGVDITALETAVKEALTKSVDRQPRKLLDVDWFTQPGYTDLCYIGFGATGDRRYIERAIKVLSQGGDGEMDKLIVATACWSLRSLSSEYPDIAEIILSVPGAVEKMEYILEKEFES